MVAWNTHIFIFGWFENILMGISYVYNLFFNCHMELAYNHFPMCQKIFLGSFHL
jgi:hypothetical protein